MGLGTAFLHVRLFPVSVYPVILFHEWRLRKGKGKNWGTQEQQTMSGRGLGKLGWELLLGMSSDLPRPCLVCALEVVLGEMFLSVILETA